MDYWDEAMQGDVYLAVTEGWSEGARPRVLGPVRGKGTAELADLTVKRRKYKMDLLPPGLVVARYFVTEQAEIDRLRAEEEALARKLDAKVLARYATLTATEIAEIVVDDKWMQSTRDLIVQQVERLAGGLVERIRVLEGRYADALPELERRVEGYGARVESHLRRMGLPT